MKQFLFILFIFNTNFILAQSYMPNENLEITCYFNKFDTSVIVRVKNLSDSILITRNGADYLLVSPTELNGVTSYSDKYFFPHSWNKVRYESFNLGLLRIFPGHTKTFYLKEFIYPNEESIIYDISLFNFKFKFEYFFFSGVFDFEDGESTWKFVKLLDKEGIIPEMFFYSFELNTEEKEDCFISFELDSVYDQGVLSLPVIKRRKQRSLGN